MIDSATRRKFDRQLDWVMERLPPEVKEILEEVPLNVEDYPSKRVMAEADVRHRDELCGWYAGVPIDHRSVSQLPTPPDTIFIYREGILVLATNQRGHVSIEALREEIRITILHEVGHHHGIDEDELNDLGYA